MKKTSKRILGIAAVVLLIAVALIGVVGAPAGGWVCKIVDVGEYGTLQGAINAVSGESTLPETPTVIVMLADTTENVSIGSTGSDGKKNITLELDGYVINGGGSGSVITINEGSKLTVENGGTNSTSHKDTSHYFKVNNEIPASVTAGLWQWDDTATTSPCTVTGGCITGGKGSTSGGTDTIGGGVLVKGTLNMEGGNIVGNCVNKWGGGVFIDSGTFLMNGGTISGNKVTGYTNGGGGVYNQGTFKLYGGSITYNYSMFYGGGVFHCYGNSIFMKVGGTAVVSENTTMYYGTSNVHLQEDGGTAKISIDESNALDTGASIGVTTYTDPTKDNSVAITESCSADYSSYFSSDKGYKVTNASGNVVSLNAHVHDNVTFTPWTSTTSLPGNAGNYFLVNDVTLTSTWNVTSGNTINLCLNGHVIKFTGSSGSVIYIKGTLNLYDCCMDVDHRHYFNVDGATGLWTLTNEVTEHYVGGGCITGGNAKSGGGVFINGNGLASGSYFTLYGGNIVGNSATENGGGVYMDAEDTFIMVKGCITGNIANDCGGGITRQSSGTITVGGTAKITGNQAKHGGSNYAADNVYLKNGDRIMIDSAALATGASIGVTTENPPTAGNPVAITYNGSSADVGYFSSDAGYSVAYNTDHLELVSGYTVNAATVSPDSSGTVTYGTDVSSITSTSLSGVSSGSEVYVKCTPAVNYGCITGMVIISDVTVTPVKQDGNSFIFEFTMPASDVTPVVTFSSTTGGYSVLYAGNGNTDGSVPVDTTKYQSGATVPVAGNTGSLVKTGYVFAGWTADGTHILSKGDTFTISANTMLVAVWFENSLVAVNTVTGVAYSLFGTAVSDAKTGETVKLLQDVVRYGTWEVNKEIGLDLNGHVLSRDSSSVTFSVITIISGGNLTLKDSNDNGLSHKFTPNENGLWELDESSGTKTVTGGCITGGTGSEAGGVEVDKGEFIMQGGSIIGNTAEYGGGVYISDNSTFRMEGGSIAGNTGTNAGGVLVVSENETDYGTFEMTGGSITDNVAGKYGAGGVEVGGHMTVGSTAKITGNTVDGNANNLYLDENVTITVSSGTPLAEGASIKVTTQTAPAAGQPVVITSDCDTDYSSYFSSDNTAYVVKYESNKLYLVIGLTEYTVYKGVASTGTYDADVAGVATWYKDGAGTGVAKAAFFETNYPTTTSLFVKSTVADGTYWSSTSNPKYKITVTSPSVKTNPTAVTGTLTYNGDNQVLINSDGAASDTIAGVTPEMQYSFDSGFGTIITDVNKVTGTNAKEYTVYYRAAVVAGKEVKIASAAENVTKSINQKQLTISGTTVADKTYDGTTSASVTAGTLDGVQGSESITVTASGFFPDVNAGTSKSVAVTYTIDGTTKDNYLAPVGENVNGTINQKQLTISGTTVAAKDYDGTTTATITAGTLSGVQGSESITVTASGSFPDASAGTSKTVAVTYTIAGATKDNYLAPAGENVNGTINQKQLTISGTTVAAKDYDGTTSASVTAGTLDGVQGSESITVTASGSFPDASAGTLKTVAVTYTIAGATKDNYLAPAGENVNGTINQKQLTISGTTVADKTYDGTTSAGVTEGTITGVINDDNVSVSGTGTFDNATVGTNKDVSVVYSLSGEKAGNYTKPVNDVVQADITAKQLTVTGTKADGKTYNGTTDAVTHIGTVGGKVDGDNVSVDCTGTFADKNAGNGKNVTVTYTISGADSGNYLTPVNDVTSADIEKRKITVTETSAEITKEYDGTTDAGTGYTLTYENQIESEDPGLSYSSAVYDTKDAGTSKMVTFSGISVSDANYTVDTTKELTGSITKKEVTVGGITASGKTYDGNTAATVDTSSATFAGKIDGDTLSVSTTGTFSDKDVGTSKTVTLGTLTLGGTDAGNYSVKSDSQTTTTANITTKEVTVTPDANQSKKHGENDPVLTYTYAGQVGSEEPEFKGALSRESGEDIGTYQITQGNLALKDNEAFKATNYSLAFTNGVTFKILSNQIAVTIARNQDKWGTVSQSSITVEYGTAWSSDGDTLTVGTTEITAAPNRGYEFASWSPASGSVTAETTITANFKEKTAYTVSMPNGGYTYGNAPYEPDISPDPREAGSIVIFKVSTVESGEGTLWTQDNGNNLGVEKYYIYAVVDGDETTRSSFNVTKATQEAPSSSFFINAKKQPVTVKIPGVDKNKSLEYSLNGVSPWTDVNLDQTNSFTLTNLEQNTEYTLLLRVQGTANYYPSDAVSQNFTTPDETPVVTLTYNGNGGSGAPDKVQVKKGTDVAIDAGSTVTKSGYKFTGWYTSGQQKVSGSMTLNEDVTLYAGWEETTYTVFFEKNGGEGTMDSQTLTTGVKDALHSSAFTRSGYNFAGWAVTATGPVAYTDGQEVSNIANGDSLTLYAVWMNEPTYSISGTLKGDAGSTVSLKLMYGASVIDTATCTIGSDGTGSYTFGKKVPNGIYDVVATSGEKTVTKMVTIEDASEPADIKITEVNSVVEVKDTNNTPPVVVGGLDEEAENYKEEGKKVTITLTVEAKVKADAPAGESEEAKKEQEVQKAIDKLEKSSEVSGSNASYLNLSVKKEVKVGTETESTDAISKTNTVMEMNIPYDFTGKKNVGMVRYHNDEVQPLASGYKELAVDGTYVLDKVNNRISLYADSFSVYAITYDEDTPTSSSSSSSVTSFTGEKNGNDFTFSNAVVITKMTLPGASYARITNTSGSGWYNCNISTDGTAGVAYFQVPLDVLNVKGYTVNDVSLINSVTTYLGTTGNYAKYSAPVTGSGAYSIGFVKGAASAGTVVDTPVTTDYTQGYLKITSVPAGAKIQIEGVNYIGYTPQEKIALNPGIYTVTLSLDGYEDAVKTVIISDDATSTVTADLKQKSGTTATTAAKSPFPVLGILAGLGAAAFFLRRR